MAKTNEFSIKKELARQSERHEEKRCIQCGGFDSRTYNGYSRCAACAHKNYVRTLALREERYSHGLCTRCGKNVPKDGKKMCQKCISYIDAHRSKK